MNLIISIREPRRVACSRFVIHQTGLLHGLGKFFAQWSVLISALVVTETGLSPHAYSAEFGSVTYESFATAASQKFARACVIDHDAFKAEYLAIPRLNEVVKLTPKPEMGVYAMALCLQGLAEKSERMSDAGALRIHTLTLNTYLRNVFKSHDQLVESYKASAVARNPKTTLEPYRAFAWLNAWVVLGRLTVYASTLPAVDRKDLQACIWSLAEPDPNKKDCKDGSGSSLRLLLDIYGHMQEFDKTARGYGRSASEAIHVFDDARDSPEPLLRRAIGRRSFCHTITSQLASKRSTERVGCFIPSESQLRGEPHASPALDDHQMLTLWGLVNLQLDTWRETAQANEGGSKTTVKPLADWLDQLAGRREGLVQGMVNKLPKLAAYLRVRQVLADKPERLQEWARLLERVRRDASNDDLKQKLVTIQNLPSGKDSSIDKEKELADEILRQFNASVVVDKEQNYQAGLWLRYLLLLSYHGETARVMMDNPNGLPKQWKDSWGIGKLWIDPLPKQSSGTQTPSYLRWNQWPSDGHSSALIGSMTLALMHLFQLEARPLAWQWEDMRKEAEKALSRIGEILTNDLVTYNDQQALEAKENVTKVWENSTTEQERTAFLDDYKVFKSYVLARTQFYRHLGDAYAEPTSEARVRALAAAFDSLPFRIGGREIAFFGAPKSGFYQYEERFKEASRRKIDEADKKAVSDLLKTELDLQKRRVIVARLHLDKADLAATIAESLSNLDQTYMRISALTAKASEFDKVAAEERLKAAKVGIERDELALNLKTRERDLTAAHVAALKTLLDEDGPRAIADAKAGLQTLKQNMLSEAAESKKEAENVFGNVLKGFISIVGTVAAACGAGPTAMKIAANANRAIDAAEMIRKTNWQNPAQVIRSVTTMTSSVEKLGINIHVQVPNDMRNIQRQLNAYFQKGAATLDFIKNISDPDIKKQVASTVLSGFALDKETFNISLAEDVLSFEDPELRKILESVLLKGGVFVNNAANRLAYFDKLVGKEDAALRAELGEAIEKAFPNLKSEIGIQHDRYQSELVQLKEYVSGNGIKAETRRLLANILSQGMTIIQTQNGVRAVAANLEHEVEKGKKDLDRIAGLVHWESLSKLGTKLSEQREKLDKEYNKIMTMEDAGQKADALKRLAEGPVIPEVEREMTTTLNEIELRFLEMKRKLDDLEIGVNIAKLTKDESRSLLEAAKASQEATELKNKALELDVEASKGMQAVNRLKVRQSTLDIHAAIKEWQLEEFKLDSLYKICQIRGAHCDDTGLVAQGSKRPVAQMFWGLENETQDSDLAGMVENLIGMIHWVTLLKPVRGEPPYKNGECGIGSVTVSGLEGWNRILLAILGARERTTQCITGLAAYIKKVYEARAPSAPIHAVEQSPFLRTTFHSVPGPGENAWKITWRRSDVDNDKIWNTIRVRLSGPDKTPAEYELEKAVGYSTITLLKPGEKQNGATNTAEIGASDSNDYLAYSQITVIPKDIRSNLYFLVIPPELPLAKPDNHETLAQCVKDAGEFKRDQASTNSDAEADKYFDAVKQNLGQKLGSVCLMGAGHGREWIVVLFHKNYDVNAAEQSDPILKIRSLSLR